MTLTAEQRRRIAEDNALDRLDDGILRDGESYRVPMTMMDAQQRAVRDANEYGSIGPGNMESKGPVPNPGPGLVSGVGGDPPDDGTTELPPAKQPTPREAAEAAYEQRNLELSNAWRGKPIELKNTLGSPTFR